MRDLWLMKKKLKERKQTIRRALHNYTHRHENMRLTRAFYNFLDAYVPRGTSSRIHEMLLYYLRGLAQKGEENAEVFYELSEDLIALKNLFDLIDAELIPLPTQYVTVKEWKAMRKPKSADGQNSTTFKG